MTRSSEKQLSMYDKLADFVIVVMDGPIIPAVTIAVIGVAIGLNPLVAVGCGSIAGLIMHLVR